MGTSRVTLDYAENVTSMVNIIYYYLSYKKHNFQPHVLYLLKYIHAISSPCKKILLNLTNNAW